MFWFWMNMPLAAACLAAWTGIPLWMVLRHPTWGPEPADGHRAQPAKPEPQPQPAAAAGRGGYLAGKPLAAVGPTALMMHRE